MEEKDYKPSHLKYMEVIDDHHVLLTFYLQYADWDISEEIMEVKIAGENIALIYDGKFKSLIGQMVYIEEHPDYLMFWEGEYLQDCSSDIPILFEHYEIKIVSKTAVEWRKQYLDLREDYYRLLGKKYFELSQFKEEIILQFENTLEKRRIEAAKEKKHIDEKILVSMSLNELKCSTPYLQSRRFTFCEQYNETNDPDQSKE